VSIEAANPGVAIYTLAFETPAGAKDHAKAEAQYQTCRLIRAPTPRCTTGERWAMCMNSGARSTQLAAAITTQVKAAYLGEGRHRQRGERQAGPGREENAR